MATKDCGLFVNKQVSGTDKSSQFSNLNLNQGHKCSPTSLVQSFSKSNYGKNSGCTVTDKTHEKTWNKSTKDLLGFKTSKTSSFLKVEAKEEKAQKRWMSNLVTSNDKSHSTLSLHISAYENSHETLNEVDRVLSKSIDPIDPLWKFQANQDFFEFPRQMEDNECAAPQIQQFKASQKLLSPNQSAPSKGQEIKSGANLGTVIDDISSKLALLSGQDCEIEVNLRVKFPNSNKTRGSRRQSKSPKVTREVRKAEKQVEKQRSSSSKKQPQQPQKSQASHKLRDFAFDIESYAKADARDSPSEEPPHMPLANAIERASSPDIITFNGMCGGENDDGKSDAETSCSVTSCRSASSTSLSTNQLFPKGNIRFHQQK